MGNSEVAFTAVCAEDGLQTGGSAQPGQPRKQSTVGCSIPGFTPSKGRTRVFRTLPVSPFVDASSFLEKHRRWLGGNGPSLNRKARLTKSAHYISKTASPTGCYVAKKAALFVLWFRGFSRWGAEERQDEIALGGGGGPRGSTTPGVHGANPLSGTAFLCDVVARSETRKIRLWMHSLYCREDAVSATVDVFAAQYRVPLIVQYPLPCSCTPRKRRS